MITVSQRFVFLLSSLLSLGSFCGGSLHAQFRGVFETSGIFSSNAESGDSSAPDRIISQAIQITQSIPFSNVFSIELTAAATQYYFSVVPGRSYFHINAGIEPTLTFTPTNNFSTASLSQITTSLLVDDLEGLNEHLSTLESGGTRDSLTVIVALLTEVLRSEPYTESVKEIIAEELTGIRSRIEQVVINRDEMNGLLLQIDNVIARSDQSEAAQDLFGIDTSPNEYTGGNENSRLLSLFQAEQFRYLDFSHRYLYLKQDTPFSNSEQRTEFTVPIVFNTQRNRGTYDLYSYREISAAPRFTFSPVSYVLLGTQYEFASIRYPNDTLLSYTSHKIWEDVRIAVSSSVVFLGSVGYGSRTYSRPFTLILRDTIRPRLPEYRFSNQSSLTQYAFGVGIAFLPLETLSLQVYGRLTLDPKIDSPEYNELITAIPAYAARVANDEFGYQVQAFYGALTARLPFDIDLGVSASFELRTYPYIQAITLLATGNLVSRNHLHKDDWVVLSTELSKYFEFSNRLLGAFDSFTASLFMTNTDVRSTLPHYNFSDFSTELRLTLGF